LVPESNTANDAGECNEKQSEMVSAIPVGEVIFGVEGVEVEGVLKRGFEERRGLGRGLAGAKGSLVKKRV
jgi:hypothetical protein